MKTEWNLHKSTISSPSNRNVYEMEIDVKSIKNIVE